MNAPQESSQPRMQAEVRHCEAKYRRLYEGIRDAFVSVGMDGRIHEYNDAYRQMLGYEPEELAALTFWDLTPARWHAVQAEIFEKQVLVRGYSDVYEKEYRRKDGTIVPVELRTILLRDDDGQPCGMWAILRDITQRRRSEEALREADRRLKMLMDASPESMLLLDPAGTILLANETTARRLGRAKSEIVGRTPYDVLPADVAANRMRHFEEVVRTRQAVHFDDVRLGRSIENVMCPVLDEQGEVSSIAVLGIDRTERKRAEEALRTAHAELERRFAAWQESEARARSLLEMVSLGVTECDTEGLITLANPAYETMTGYSREELVGMPIVELIEEGPQRAALDEYFKYLLLEQPTPAPYRCRDVTKDGRLLDVQVDWAYKRNGQGQVAGFISVISDITERMRAEEALKTAHAELERRVEERTAALRTANQRLQREVEERRRAEEALRESHEQLQTIHDGMVEGLLITDIETKRFVRFNASLCRMLGYSEEELREASVQDIHPPEEVPEDLQRFQAAAEGRVSINEDRPVLRKDGSIFYADITGRRILYEGRPCLLALFRDVTERRQAKEALRTSEERFRSYFEQALIGMAVTGIDGQWLEVNDRLCDILGYARDELVAMNWRDATHPDDLDASLLPFRRMVAGEIEHYTHDKRFVRKDGSVVYATIFVRCVRRNGGAIDHVLALIEDITDRKRSEAALERERRTLKHLLQSSDHDRQLIAYEIHDGLAQQLAGAIMQFDAYTAQKQTEPRSAAQAFEAGMTMLRQGHFEARRLISGVRPPILDEAGVVAAVAHLVNEERRKKGPKIQYLSEVEFERLTPILENAIYRIVQEALANACGHSKSRKVRVELVQQGLQLRIKIRDWGIGFRLEDIGESHFGVAGIRERARLLGGNALIDSEPGKGTQIIVDLPVVLAAKEGNAGAWDDE